MKKYAFFKYFIKNKVFTGGGEGGNGWGGVGCSIFTSGMVWGRERGRGRGYSNPPPIRPVAMSRENPSSISE